MRRSAGATIDERDVRGRLLYALPPRHGSRYTVRRRRDVVPSQPQSGDPPSLDARMSRHLPLIGLAVVVTVSAGIVSAREPAAERPQGIAFLRARLVAELRADASTRADSAVDPARVRFDSTRSAVVPGLSLLTASYGSPGRDDAWVDAALAVRGAESRALRVPSDLARVVGAWRPVTSRDAVGFCVETIGFSSAARHPFVPPFTFGVRDETLPAALVDRATIEATVTPPVARRTSPEDWRVTLWQVETGRTRLYECRLHSGAEGLGVGLTVIDSIAGAGLPAGR